MKILHIIPSLEIGGAQKLLTDLIPLQSQENEIGVLVLKKEATNFEKLIKESKIQFISLNVENFYSLSNIFKIKANLKEWDIIHVHLFPTLYWVALASIGLKKKLVYTEHSTHNKRRDKSFFRPIERFIYSRYNSILCISNQTKENLIKWLRPKSTEKFHVIENGIDLNKFSPNSEAKNNEIIMVSRFAEMKDQETLIKAMKYVNSEVYLSLVGDGPNRKNCERIAKEEGVNERVKFLGAQSDIPTLLSKAYIGVQSSKWEGFGLTAIEYMASGLPIVCSNVPGLSQIVGDAGLKFEVGDSEKLAEQINRLISDVELYNKLKERGLKVAKKYSINSMNKKYLDIYTQL
ncbi:MAG: glycosyltransferase [Muribaculaceae bacterium]|nr:glycosyltransferase [Muribaculaceae bacterium]